MPVYVYNTEKGTGTTKYPHAQCKLYVEIDQPPASLMHLTALKPSHPKEALKASNTIEPSPASRCPETEDLSANLRFTDLALRLLGLLVSFAHSRVRRPWRRVGWVLFPSSHAKMPHIAVGGVSDLEPAHRAVTHKGLPMLAPTSPREALEFFV